MGQLDGVSMKKEATALAAQIWCEPQWEKRPMDVHFAESIRDILLGVIKQREAWIKTARLNQRNADFWELQVKGTA